ncbi:cytochrome P450 CYP82D47-like [Pistacia vera]|uniref:cytochrome P450 CYP82D47-like n=1 Tax=Pistacia vera TaxID=55513 RepID=UPI001262AF97|nr:cytochrome P450 CYP82D47-like [Pistacia vera]
MNFLLAYLNTTIIGVFVTLLIFSCYLLRRSNSNSTKGPKAPEAAGKWPVIGHLPVLAGSQLPHFTLGALADKYGPVFCIRVGVYPALVVSSWEVAKELFTTYDVDVSSRPKLTTGKLLGHNYANFGFSPYGAYWREMRKITAVELLSNRRLDLLKHVRATEVEHALKEIYKFWTKARNESSHVLVETKQWFGDLNLNVILRMVAGKRYFGADAATDEKEVRRCRKAMREFFDLAGLFVVRDALPFLGWLDIGGYEKAMKKTFKELDSLVEEWLEEHRRKKEAGEVAAKEEQDFIDMLLSVLIDIDLSGFDIDTVIKATCLTIIVGATDTTTVNLTWALSLLLNNHHALDKVQEELDSVVGKERLLSESDVDKLVYLQAVVKETLRLYPAGPLGGGREFTKDCTISGYYVPKGTRLLLNIWKIQTDLQVWSDPLEFKPERFLTTHKDIDVNGQHFELIPFGGGRRACPGILFGLQMTHLALASLLHAFDITTPSSAPVDMTGTPGMTNIRATPLEILVKPRLSHHLYG